MAEEKEVKVNGDILGQLVAITKPTMDRILKEKHQADLIALWMFYAYTSKWQDEQTCKAVESYCEKGLGIGHDRFIRAKNKLFGLGLIEPVERRKNGKITGHYVRVNYIISIKTEKELKKKIIENINHTVEKPPMGKTTSGKTPPKCSVTNKLNAPKLVIEMLSKEEPAKKPQVHSCISEVESESEAKAGNPVIVKSTITDQDGTKVITLHSAKIVKEVKDPVREVAKIELIELFGKICLEQNSEFIIWPKAKAGWSHQIDLMIDEDHRTMDGIRQKMLAIKGSYWWKKMYSLTLFRKQYHTLGEPMFTGGGAKPHYKGHGDQKDMDYDAKF